MVSLPSTVVRPACCMTTRRFCICFASRFNVLKQELNRSHPRLGEKFLPCSKCRNCTASPVGAQPSLWRKPLLRKEAALVIHLARAPDPIAKVHVGEPHFPRPGDVVEDHEGAERPVLGLRFIK